MEILGILITSVLISNVVVSYFVGVEDSLNSAKSPKATLGIGILTVISTVVSAVLANLVNTYVLKAMNLTSLSLLVNVIVISIVALIVTKVFKVIKKDSCPETSALLSTLITNNMILFVVLQTVNSSDLVNVVVTSLGMSLGFFFISYVVMAMEQRMQSSQMMPAFKGKPAMLILMGVLALILTGFGGII